MTTTPKLYRDMLPNDSQIYNDPYAKKQSGSQSPDISETINKGLDEAYCAGIDHAIKIVEDEKEYWGPDERYDLFSKSLITKLEQLKKKP
jgi:hypothetical protein